jgi:hypothetical protein
VPGVRYSCNPGSDPTVAGTAYNGKEKRGKAIPATGREGP